MLYSAMLVSAVQKSESAVCVHISPPSPASLPTPAPCTPLGRHGTPNTLWGTAASQELSVCLSDTRGCVCVSATLPAGPALPPPPCVHMLDMLLVSFLVSKYRSQEAAATTEECI